MSKIGIFYGTTTSQTETVAAQIRDAFGAEVEMDLHNITEGHPEIFAAYDSIILGIPTWNIGELQADWDIFFPKFEQIDFTGKKAALFGLGDSAGYPDSFLDAMRPLYDVLVKNGAQVVGFWPSSEYSFGFSKAVIDGNFVGLGIDNDAEAEKTPDRIQRWVEYVKPQLTGIPAQGER